MRPVVLAEIIKELSNKNREDLKISFVPWHILSLKPYSLLQIV